MSELMFIVLLVILVALWITYLRFITSRWKGQNATSPEQYLWELRKITGKGEYELFHIAAEEKGWPENQVENHFRRFLEDQTLPIYMKQFLEEGKAYIDDYRSGRAFFFDKKLILAHAGLGAVLIGGSFIIALYIFPILFQWNYMSDFAVRNAIRVNPRLAPHFIERAISMGEKGQIERACHDLGLACDLGYCEEYSTKIKEGVCLEEYREFNNADRYQLS